MEVGGQEGRVLGARLAGVGVLLEAAAAAAAAAAAPPLGDPPTRRGQARGASTSART